MPAKARKDIPAVAQRLIQIHPAGAARAAHARLAVARKRHGGIAVTLGQPPGDQPHHAAFPALALHHNGAQPAQIHLACLSIRLLHNALLHRLAAGVERICLSGQRGGAGCVAGGEQIQRDIRRIHAPAGIDARRQQERGLHTADIGALLHARRLHQRAQAGARRLPHGAQPQRGQGAVFAQQRHHIGNRGQPSQLKAGQNLLARQRAGQLVGNARAAQIAAGIIA